MEEVESADLMEWRHLKILRKLCLDRIWINIFIGVSEGIIVHHIIQDCIVDLEIESFSESHDT